MATKQKKDADVYPQNTTLLARIDCISRAMLKMKQALRHVRPLVAKHEGPESDLLRDIVEEAIAEGEVAHRAIAGHDLDQ